MSSNPPLKHEHLESLWVLIIDMQHLDKYLFRKLKSQLEYVIGFRDYLSMEYKLGTVPVKGMIVSHHILITLFMIN